MYKEAKKLSQELLQAGHKLEAYEVMRLAKSLSNEERDRQEGIVRNTLDDIRVPYKQLNVDSDTALISFSLPNMSVLGFDDFCLRLLRRLCIKGNKIYELDHIERKTPMKMYIKFKNP
jgi:hypothetical protein